MSKPASVTINGSTYRLSNRGPLTTTFTPAAPCLTDPRNLDAQSRIDCFPPHFLTPVAQAYYFSPGLCPASYTQNRPLAQWWLGPGETGVECCPRYSFHPRLPLIADMASGYSIATSDFLSCSQFPGKYPSTSDGTPVTITVDRKFLAPAIAVIWKSGDFTPSTKTTKTTPTTTHDSVHSARSTPPTESVETTTDTTPRSRARTILIATVGPIALLLVGILALIVTRRRAPAITVTPPLDLDIKRTDIEATPAAVPRTPTPTRHLDPSSRPRPSRTMRSNGCSVSRRVSISTMNTF